MDAKTDKPHRPDLFIATEGEFAGWRTWTRDTFESNNGPFWHKIEADGHVHHIPKGISTRHPRNVTIQAVYLKN